MDLFWPGVCIVEMKRPSEAGRLPTHRAQALQYWQRSGTPRSPAPRYVVLCAFHRFEVWEPGAVYTEPRAVLDLVDLPDNLDVLNFLVGRNPVFETGGADLTREAVALVTDLYQQLRELGNPPYHGDRMLRRELGDEYVEWLKDEFGVGVKDYCVYWFRKAHDCLEEGGRAGLVGTNSISQNRGRSASLEYIVANGGAITHAVSTQDWSGEAAVDVSIVNWVKDPVTAPTEVALDGVAVPGISPSLRSTNEADVASAARLSVNFNRSFQGTIPRGAGFVLRWEEGEQLLSADEADYAEVVRPYLVGEDIADQIEQGPRRFIVDFAQMPLEAAARYPAALALVRERVKPLRDLDPVYANSWWQLWRPRPEMRLALVGLERYVAGVAQGKRIFFSWQDKVTCPSNLTNVFAFDDDFSMGLLSSTIHHEWARAQSSTLEDRFRYTPTSAFETFPWPQPEGDLRETVATSGLAMTARCSEICLERQIGLTALYNELDDGAYRDLRDLHVSLDEAVAAAYGWPASAAHDTAVSNRLLLELNLAISAGEVAYHPFD